LAVGVSKYTDQDMNLTYSDKDAGDLTAAFADKNKLTGQYGNVYLKVLANERADADSVVAAASFLKKSKVNDQVILFFSGHGLIDPNMDYYLAMHNTVFTNPSDGGLLYTRFQDLLDGLPARKRLVFIDACHSGEFDRNELTAQAFVQNNEEKVTEKDFKFRGKKVIGIANANDLMKELFADLRKETGATVISSSTGTELSVEGKQWKNGAFTFALLDGLIGMKADADHNKEITVRETRDYITGKVKELTGGRQNPTTRQENIDFDYRIW
jgi:uncharacterized caspase-like protein